MRALCFMSLTGPDYKCIVVIVNVICLPCNGSMEYPFSYVDEFVSCVKQRAI